jgi:hypothetical protein
MNRLAPVRLAFRATSDSERPLPKYRFLCLHFTPARTSIALPFENLSTKRSLAWRFEICLIETFVGELIPNLKD